MTTINLVKGQKIDLTKGTNLKKIRVGLGWDTNKYNGGFDFDLDATAFILDGSDKAYGYEDIVFYNNLSGANGSVVHTGDNLTGEGDGDDESVIIDFSKVPDNKGKIAITVTIHDALKRAQNFGQVSNAYVRVINEENEEEILRYNLGEDFHTETAVVVCDIYRYNGEWKFSAIGSGFTGGLQALCKNYGLETN